MVRSRGWQKFKSGMKRAYQRYDRMMEKQGFYVVLAICVLVIGLSAFYTFRLRSEEEEPVLTSGEAKSADSSQAQTLSEAKELVTGSETVLAVPTEAPFSLSQPVSGFLDRTFSDTEPQFFAQTNAWQVHAGIDLQAEYGTAVSACAGGKVERVWQDNELGLCVLIDREQPEWTGHVGFVPNYVKELGFDTNKVAILCGPPIMIKFTLAGLIELGFDKTQVYTTLELRMKCGIGKCGRCNVGAKYVCKDGPVFRCDQLDELPNEY